MPTLYLTFGPTHSGKTTFGKKLLNKLSDTKTILVDNDSVDSYLKENFDNLRTDPDIIRTRTPNNPDLRLRIPQLITDYALTESYNVIVTASHSRKEIRAQYLEIAKRHAADVVLLIFETSAEETLARIENGDRQNLSLGGQSFEELFRKQYNSLDIPDDQEKNTYHKVYTINEHNTDEVLENIF